VFIEMFKTFAKNPNNRRLPATWFAELELPISTREILYNIEERIVAFLLPIFATSHPAKGNEIKKPSGRANNIRPRAETLSCRVDWMVGMREAQVAKESPCITKKTLTARRFMRGEMPDWAPAVVAVDCATILAIFCINID
jgi:hypothetical protein